MVAKDLQDVDGRPAVLVVTAGMGGGHLGASAQIADRLESVGYAVPIVDMLGGMAFGYGRFIDGFYRAQLRHAMWSYRAVYDRWRAHPERMAFANRVNTVMARHALCAAVDEHDPVAILSTYNLATQVLGALAEDGSIDVPVYTFITDFGVHPYWLHPECRGYATVHAASARAVQRDTDAPVVVTGPFVDPAFAPDAARRTVTRRGLGVAEDEHIALVVAGAWGVGDVEATVDDLEHVDAVTPVVVCGHNPGLARRLRRNATGPVHVLGWVDTMPELMDAADVLVENAGGLTAMEAFVSGLPVVTYRPIPAHGTDNANAMSTARVTRFAADRDALARVVRAAVDDGPGRRAMIDAGRAVCRPDAVAALTGLIDPSRRAGSAGRGVPAGNTVVTRTSAPVVAATARADTGTDAPRARERSA